MDYKLHAGDIDIQVYERGNRESDDLIIFLHGGPGSGAAPLMKLAAFQAFEKNYHCIYFDQRGCGKSEYDLCKGLRLQQLTTDVHYVVKDCRERYQPKHVIIWGGSFGGSLACFYMEQYQGCIDCLLLSNPAITFSREQALSFFSRMQKQSAKRLGIQSEDETSEQYIPEEQLQEKEFVAFVHSPKNPSMSLRHIQAMSSWFFLQNAYTALRSIKIPCMILNGEDDAVCDSSATLQAAKACENDWFYCVSLPSCGHAVFEERTDDFIALNMEFLENVL